MPDFTALNSDSNLSFDERLAARHEKMLSGDDRPPEEDDELLAVESCLRLLDRVRRQSSVADSQWLFDTTGEADDGEAAIGEAADGFPSLDEQPPRIGRFEIERRIGEGGLGVVFLAVDPDLGRRVALKIPRPEVLVSKSWRGRFLREAEAAARLDHPRIVPVYEIGQAGSLCYLVQAWCNGLSLDRWLDNRPHPLAAPAAARLVATLAETVQHAHARGVLHRDIKPSNILLEVPEQEGRAAELDENRLSEVARLADFGLARIGDDDAGNTRSGAIVGTPSYMAPEQADGRTREVSAAADVYGLGAVLYELLLGMPPHGEPSLLATLQAVRECDPLSPRLLNPAVPRDLEAICLKCLEKSPDRRYATAHELAEDLHRYVAGEVVVARPATRAERLVRWCRRRPAQAGLTVVVCALAACLVGGLGTAAWMLDQARDRALDHLRAAQQARDQAEGNARRAVHAEYEARLAEAQAVRFSGSAGRRRESLAAIQRAVRLLPDLNLDGDPRHALRQEAYEALKLVDLQPVATWQVPGGLPLGPIGVDHDRDRYAWADPATSRLSIHRCSDSQRQRILTLPQEVERIADIQFSADGRYLAARCARPDGTVEVPVWSVDDPHPRIRVAAMPGQATAFDFSPDSQWLAVALPAGSVGLYATPDFRLVRTLEDKVAAWTVRFDSSSTRLASYRVGRIDIATVDTGQVLQTISCPSFVAQLDFSSDGQLLAAACEDKLVRTWTLPGGRLMGSLAGHDTAVSQVRFQPQGHFLASAGRSGTTLLWSLRGDPQAVLRIPLPLTSFSRDGQLLGLGGTWQRILDVDHQSVAIPLLPGSRSSAAERLSVDHTGQVLAVSSGKQLALVDLAAARVTASMVTTDTYPQFDPPGKALLAATNHGLYRSPARWEGDNALRRFTCGESQQLTSATSGYVVASRDGQRLAWADRYFQPRVMVYDESTQSARQLLPHHEGARWLSLSASGRWLVTGAWQRNDVCVWDVTTGTLVTRLKTASARVAFHPDETQLAVNEGHQWTVYGTRDWVPVAPATQRSPTADPGPLAYSEDGRLLALLGAPRRIELRDTTSWEKLLTIEVPGRQEIESLLFVRGDSMLVAGSAAPGAIHLWDLQSIRQQLAELDLDWSGGHSATPGVPEPAEPWDMHLDLPNLAPEPESSVAQWEAKVAEVTQRLQSAPDDPPGYAVRGNYYVYLKRFERAIADCSHALRLKPGMQSAHFWRGRAYQELGNYSEAINDFEVSLRIKPDDGWCCRHLAWMYAVGPEEVRDAPRSLELAERAVQLLKARSTPYLHTYLTTLGAARYRNGDLDGALDALQRAKGANGQQLPTPTAVLLLAMCNQQMGHPDEARRLYDEAVGWNERLVGFDPVSFQLLQGEAAGLLGLQR